MSIKGTWTNMKDEKWEGYDDDYQDAYVCENCCTNEDTEGDCVNCFRTYTFVSEFQNIKEEVV